MKIVTHRLVGISGYVESDGGNDLFMRVWSKYIILHNHFNFLKHQNVALTGCLGSQTNLMYQFRCDSVACAKLNLDLI